MNTRRRLLSVVLMMTMLGTLATGTSARAATNVCGNSGAKPGEPIIELPWAQTRMDYDRIHTLSTGKNQLIAVIDTGADPSHQQLGVHKVLAGYDVLRGIRGGNVDCNGHGTGAASLINAKQINGIGLRGIAPDATVVPIRVGNSPSALDTNDPARPTAKSVASGIRIAVAFKVRTIVVIPAFLSDSYNLRAAVNEALRAGIVVVAAAGDTHDPDGPAMDSPTYPAAYTGVIGVGAVSENLTRVESSVVGKQVKVTAPGAAIIAAARTRGQARYDGTGIAASFVAGTAALVRQAWPQLNGQQVTAQIIASADPSPDARPDLSYTPGILNPYRAVTESLAAPSATPRPVAGIAAPKIDPVAEEQADWWHWTTTVAVITALVMIVLLFAIIIGAGAMARGHRRDWRPGRAAPPPPAPEDDHVDDDEDIFALPTVGPPNE